MTLPRRRSSTPSQDRCRPPDSLAGVLLLALDTATTAITAALHDGRAVLAEATTLDARGHAEHLAPGVSAVLAAAGARPGDLTHVAVGLGPGPFTGLRVGVVTARTLALSTGASLHGVCSLDALAHQAWRTGSVGGPELVVVTDARRKEVYWARYAGSARGVRRLTDPAVAAPADLPAGVVALPAVGRGAVIYPGWFAHASLPTDVSAGWLADLVVERLAAGDPVDAHEPLYLRRPDATASVTAKSALG